MRQPSFGRHDYYERPHSNLLEPVTLARRFRVSELEMNPRPSRIEAFRWLTSPRLHELANSKIISKFDVRSLGPRKFSFPYHFHRAAEELFVVLEGAAKLRTPSGIEEVQAGDVVFFEAGADGAHQLFNPYADPCVYVDVSVSDGLDVIEYPDSGKLGVDGTFFPFDVEVDYYEGEENPESTWPGHAEDE